MKKIHIVGLVIVAIAIGAIITLASNYSTYETFSSAKGESNRDFKIIGQLDKSKEMYYDAQKDPNYFTFWMKDKDSVACKVILYTTKPAEFERTDQIVVTGKMKGNEFEAKSVQMKCPSKYKADETVFSKPQINS
ncbi:MAG TPA: cytochrome c maturation protein CcmE [Chitinophagales bacterium]|nr:cytochrome c maturation protein CcmE [Chitinophagales bacterium]